MSNAIVWFIAKHTINAFLTGAVLRNVTALRYIVKRAIKHCRRVIHHRVNARVAIDKDKIRGFCVRAVELADKSFALSPPCKRAMRVMFDNVMNVFYHGHVDNLAMSGYPEKCV